VASAVGQLASDFHPDIKKMALKAQGKWGVLSITQLMGQLNSNDFGVRHAAIQALAVTKKPEAAEAIAARLQDGFDRRTAVEALRSMGSVAEPAVVKYMHHYDAGVAQEVRSLLIGYGTKDDVLLTQTLKDLFFPKVEVCRSAVKWFAEGRQIDKSRRHEVMKAFNRLPIVVYTFKDKEILQNFLVALERLGGDENLKGIILQLNDEKEGVRQEAMSSLAKSKHPRALDVLARELTNKKNRADAAKALREAGSEAEGVIVVVMDQFIADPTLLLEGCRILEEIGTKDSLQLLYKIGGLYQKSNKGLYNAADKAARAIAKRESMGGVRLLDLDVPIRLGVLVRPVLTWRSLEVREHLLS
jgi:HEAT repeat protein